MITAQKLEVRAGARLLMEDVTFRIAAGDKVGLVGRNGLLPVENLGIPSVWIDHTAYQRQRHKQCVFNLYAAAMLQ